MATNKLLLMISEFLFGDYDANEFSFDFPAKLVENYYALENENAELAAYLNDEMPDVCGWFDPYNTGDRYTLNEDQFREKVTGVYLKAVSLTVKDKRAS